MLLFFIGCVIHKLNQKVEGFEDKYDCNTNEDSDIRGIYYCENWFKSNVGWREGDDKIEYLTKFCSGRNLGWCAKTCKEHYKELDLSITFCDSTTPPPTTAPPTTIAPPSLPLNLLNSEDRAKLKLCDTEKSNLPCLDKSNNSRICYSDNDACIDKSEFERYKWNSQEKKDKSDRKIQECKNDEGYRDLKEKECIQIKKYNIHNILPNDATSNGQITQPDKIYISPDSDDNWQPGCVRFYDYHGYGYGWRDTSQLTMKTTAPYGDKICIKDDKTTHAPTQSTPTSTPSTTTSTPSTTTSTPSTTTSTPSTTTSTPSTTTSTPSTTLAPTTTRSCKTDTTEIRCSGANRINNKSQCVNKISISDIIQNNLLLKTSSTCFQNKFKIIK